MPVLVHFSACIAGSYSINVVHKYSKQKLKLVGDLKCTDAEEAQSNTEYKILLARVAEGYKREQ